MSEYPAMITLLIWVFIGNIMEIFERIENNTMYFSIPFHQNETSLEEYYQKGTSRLRNETFLRSKNIILKYRSSEGTLRPVIENYTFVDIF